MSLDTLPHAVRHEIEVKHSRFLAIAGPATTPEAALAFIATVGTADATHNCWAYRIGGLYRSSDDGEPAGTAGRPILAAIDGQGFDQVAVVVTRWYGGIKLGAGGLVRAYGGCAAVGTYLVETRELRLSYPFEHTGVVHAALAAHEAEKLDETFDSSGATLTLRLPSGRVDALRVHLRDATRDQVSVDDAP